MARGLNGQNIYIDPKAEVVIIRHFALHPVESSIAHDPTFLPAYLAIAKHLLLGRNVKSEFFRNPNT